MALEITPKTIDFPETKLVLNQAVADLSKAMSIIHQAHWYARGKGFIAFHEKMDEYMDGLADALDEFSERLIMLGGKPFSTLKEFDEESNLTEIPGSYDVTIAERLERLVELYRYLSALYQTGLEVTDKEGDDVTNGLFADALGDSQKIIWMLQAELNQAPNL
ncbi:DNA starvation/stationary phase protection protein [Streptococcus hillyeri]|uniref:DNA starvation/stationary phase protection protein n=1 Tax=Streptococcus hillyeri TaxID=2282420 RepID=A0A3L9DSQ6_9STRE|nr:DNA starvation/stationary phase protection protein [Streptococcus hillyeri]